jgi:protein-L-isoaspartate(D-aspartate) O-methyltransferase
VGPPTELMDMLRAHVRDERVLDAVAAVDRAQFVPPELRDRAWENAPLPIGRGQTISQPLVVARMLEVLDPDPGARVLDVGTGSGWHAALLGRLAGRVWSIERQAALVEGARAALDAAGVDNVTVLVGDGSHGLADRAPFDAINVAAAAAGGVPPALADQLAPGGRMVVPVGDADQHLVVLERKADGEIRQTELEPVRFVPLVSS